MSSLLFGEYMRPPQPYQLITMHRRRSLESRAPLLEQRRLWRSLLQEVGFRNMGATLELHPMRLAETLRGFQARWLSESSQSPVAENVSSISGTRRAGLIATSSLRE